MDQNQDDHMEFENNESPAIHPDFASDQDNDGDEPFIFNCADKSIALPHKLVQMSKTLAAIDERDEDERRIVNLKDFHSQVLIKVAQYCKQCEYSKTESILQYPLASRLIQDHIQQIEYDYILPHLDNFDDLLRILKLAKHLQIEALYELCCASIAAFFRNRTYEDVKKDLSFNNVFMSQSAASGGVNISTTGEILHTGSIVNNGGNSSNVIAGMGLGMMPTSSSQHLVGGEEEIMRKFYWVINENERSQQRL
eukprot:403351640